MNTVSATDATAFHEGQHNAAHNKNTLKSISNSLRAWNDEQDQTMMEEGSTTPSVKYYEGCSMNAIWAVRSLGIDPATGRELYLTKDGKTTTEYRTEDQVVCGDAMPKCSGTFGVNMDYRGIFMNLSFYYQFGGQTYNQTLVDRVENVNIANNVDRRVLSDTWQKAGDVAKFKHIGSTPSTTYATTRFIEKNNELQFASFSCYYDFKYQSWLQKIKLERLKLSFYMNDLFRVSTVKTERGLDYPYARSFSFQLSATF